MKRIFLVFILTLASTASLAVTVLGLYDGEVVVPARTPAALNKAIPKAFQQVLIKVSGNSAVATNPEVVKQLDQVSSWVSSYSYHTRTLSDDTKQILLHVRFDKRSVLNVLRNADQGVWSAKRPQVMLWLTIQDSEGSTIVTNDSNSKVAELVEQDANQRGLPIVLPIMDLTDMAAVTVADIASFNGARLSEAAQRYHMKNILIGSVYLNLDGTWTGQWQLQIDGQINGQMSRQANGQAMQWNINAKSLAQTIAEGIDNASDAVATRFAVLEDADLKTNIMVQVVGVDGLNGFADVLKYFRSLSPVSHVELYNVDKNSITVNVTALGGEQALTHVIAQSRRLLPVSGDLQLSYRWQKVP